MYDDLGGKRLLLTGSTPAFFASHAASGYVTGQVLDIDGGPFKP
jgi:hypothetical protein